MKKQYTTEEAYNSHTKVTFYEDGSEVYYKVVADYNLSVYLEAKEEDGWEWAHSHKEMEYATKEIKKLEHSLTWWKKNLEEIKDNLIGG